MDKATREWGLGLLTIAWNEGTIRSRISGPEGPSTTGGNSGDEHEPPVGVWLARRGGREGGRRRDAWVRISAWIGAFEVHGSPSEPSDPQSTVPFWDWMSHPVFVRNKARICLVGVVASRLYLYLCFV
jgi:hypothetical protein